MIVEAFMEAALYFFSWEALLLILAGTLLGLVFGALPGLGGSIALALLIPITHGMELHLAFILMSSAVGGVAFGGSVSAILINVPGTVANAATLLDGHPLAQNGRANEAIGVSAISSAIGAMIGLLFLILTIPILRQVLLLFGPPEFFAITVVGIFVIAYAIKSSLLNGLIAGGLGMMLSFVGFDFITGGSRYTFDVSYLYDGIGLVPLIIGVFAISEMMYLLVQNRKIANEGLEKGGSTLKGVSHALTNKLLLLQSSLIGIIIGMLPGAGGSVANFVAYAASVRTSKSNPHFGQGDIRGVISAEAANDAKDGGALIPTIGFGIPGSGVWAVMLGAFILHGIRPGPQLLGEELPVVFIIIIALFLSNILTSAIGIVFASWLAKITITPPTIIAPIILTLSLFGAYAIRQNVMDMWLAVIIGLFGYIMIKYNISRITFVIGFILGPIAEGSFHQSLQISRGSYAIFLTSPISAIIFLGLAMIILLPFIQVGYKAVK